MERPLRMEFGNTLLSRMIECVESFNEANHIAEIDGPIISVWENAGIHCLRILPKHLEGFIAHVVGKIQLEH